MMMNSKSLSFYKISDGDMIVAFDGRRQNVDEIESFIEKVAIRKSPSMRKEVMRIRDLKMMRLSKKDEIRFYQFLQVEKPAKVWPTCVCTEKFSSPCEDPLPILF